MKDVIIRERILKNGKKVYEYRFEICSVDGKRKHASKSGFSTKAEARKAGMEAQALYWNKGKVIKNHKLSFADFLDTWIENDCMITLKESTIIGYKKKIDNHIKPALGTMNIHSITREDLQIFVNDKYDKGYSRNTLSSLIGILTKSLNYAADNGYIAVSPAVRIKIPKNRTPTIPTRTKERVNIPDEIIHDIFERFPESSNSHIPLLLGYECGLRIGEVFGLVWEDIDFENRTLTVNRQIQWHQDQNRSKDEIAQDNGHSECGNGYWYFTNPKYNSFRTIDITEHLAELLKREYQKQVSMQKAYGEYHISYYSKYKLHFNGKTNPIESIDNPINSENTGYKVNFICVRNDGSYISSRTMQHTSNVIRNTIYSNFSFHALRHTHASQLYAAGVSDKYISERLGHKGEHITKDVYIHLTDKARTNSRKVLEELYQKPEK